MQKSSKLLILVVLLILPVLIFLFLNHFGRNHYNLLVYYPLDSTQVNGKWQVKYHTIADFELINQVGKTITQQDLKGKVYVADFFFTRCGNPTFCPRMSSELSRVQTKFINKPQVQLVSFTVDPEHDTPEVLRKYAQNYQADAEKWYFLTGSKKTIYDLAFSSFKVNALEEKDVVTPDFIHTSKLILVDEKGRIRGYYDGTSREDVDRLMLEIEILLYESKIK
jgi:protein SCO1